MPRSVDNDLLVRFVDETQDLRAFYSTEDESCNLESPGQAFSASHHDDDIFSSALESSPATLLPTATPGLEILSTDDAHNLETSPAEAPHRTKIFSDIPAGSLLGRAGPNLTQKCTAFPLKQDYEVRLMKHYIDHMCHWFDLCDTKGHHFAYEVPRRAITCPTLLNAIFALSSRHLSITGHFDEYASDRYHQECLKHLTTISDDASALTNDDLLAATILLRTLEELEVPLVGTDYQGHLLGIQVFMNTQSTSVASSLRQASFWIGLRQEIYMAFVNQRPVKTKLDHSFVDRSFSPADDDTWANRIIVNCAEITKFCFNQDEQTISNYKKLKDYDAQWLDSRPLSFLPLSYREPDQSIGEVFPEICYLSHAIGQFLAYYHLHVHPMLTNLQ
ncbi:hypothetical protein BP5796_12288 [Coleophoma crateriformis]|uniref:Uncharacterized protein n=1 Tax=Coleophoma crateriformis TaxID=565419 RepID=A0A3D8Q9R9_9HELO|nr:hypothetical protein BP5796_12288 [Coleophoma crateriformis]